MVRLACNDEEIKAAQRLRYRVFVEELGAEIENREKGLDVDHYGPCLLYTSPSPRDQRGSRMPSSA